MTFIPETRNLFATIATVNEHQKHETVGRLVLGWSKASTLSPVVPVFESGRADGMPLRAEDIFPDCKVFVSGYVVVEASE